MLAPIWRRERDSNPRDAINAYTISNRAPSTSSAISPQNWTTWIIITTLSRFVKRKKKKL